MPLQRHERFEGHVTISTAIVMEYEGDHAKVVKALRNSMAFHHGFDPKDDRAVFVFDVFADLPTCSVITTGIKILLGFIGLLTLGIGGVGLMNIMLVSVTQRTREIGVEKALGAHRWHILFQFLAEALVITALGGLLGVALAYVVSWSVGSLTLWSAFEENASEGDIHLFIDPHADLVHRHSELCRNRQRHVARHQGCEARSHRSFALRVASRVAPASPPAVARASCPRLATVRAISILAQ